MALVDLRRDDDVDGAVLVLEQQEQDPLRRPRALARDDEPADADRRPVLQAPKLVDADGACVFGSTVDLQDINSKEKVTYQIVGEDEADLKLAKVSISSPIARALIGKYAGDEVDVQAPGGVKQYEILDVQYL